MIIRFTYTLPWFTINMYCIVGLILNGPLQRPELIFQYNSCNPGWSPRALRIAHHRSYSVFPTSRFFLRSAPHLGSNVFKDVLQSKGQKLQQTKSHQVKLSPQCSSVGIGESNSCLGTRRATRSIAPDIPRNFSTLNRALCSRNATKGKQTRRISGPNTI